MQEDDVGQPKIGTVFASKLFDDIRGMASRLNQLWDQVHMEANDRENRLQQSYEFIQNFIKDIVTSEEEMVKVFATDLEYRRNSVADLRTLLRMSPFKESIYPSDSITLLKALNDDYKILVKKRVESLEQQRILNAKYTMLCHRTGSIPKCIEGIQNEILKEADKNFIKHKISEMALLLEKRLHKAIQCQSEAKRIFDSIQLPSNNSISEEDFHHLKMDLYDQNTVISSELLDRLTALDQKLRDYHDSWIEQVAFRYDELLIKLDELSSKCFRPPFSRDYSAQTNTENITEKKLQQLEEEVRTRQELYERAQPIFDKLNEWMSAWKQKLDTERRVCRASFYKNRGGSLNQKLKQRRIVEQQVPKLFNELHGLCEEYVKQHHVFDVLVEGMRPDKYAQHVMESYDQDRELQRVRKQMSVTKIPQTPLVGNRSRFTPTSIRSGYTPSTPRSGFASSAPTPTPKRTTAKRALNPPATVGPIARKRSFSCSELSAIYPLPEQPRFSGPRTSSPKADEM